VITQAIAGLAAEEAKEPAKS